MSETPPWGWDSLPIPVPWPIPVDYISQPDWWISPPFPPFPDTTIIGEGVGCKLMDEDTQEVRLIIASTGMNIEEDDISLICKIAC